MEKYVGDIPVPEDNMDLPAALSGLLKYVERTVVTCQGTQSDAEKKELAACIKIALQGVKIPPVQRMTIHDFDLECLTGFGSFGQIWKADSPKFGPVALKQLKAEANGIRNLWNERNLMVYLKHKRICNLIAAFYDKDVYFVLQLCHGSVAHLCPRISPENSVRFAVQLLQAVEWIHSKKVIHADIKPDNCLINTSNNLVLSDFGSAIYLKDRAAVTFSVPHGSPGYIDYKATKDFEFSQATDVFSAACVIYEMNTKSTLLYYQDSQDQSQKVYVEAFEKGRVMSMNKKPNDQDYQRERLEDRALRCSFGYLLEKLVSEENRLTAAEALKDESLFAVLDDSNVNIDTVDKSRKFVTREFTQDYSYSFDNFSDDPTPELELALLTFSYEDTERDAISSSDSSDADLPEPIIIVSQKKAKRAKKSPKTVVLNSSSIDSTEDTDSD